MTTSTQPHFFSAYAFDGDPDELVLAFDRLAAQLPEDELLLQVCVRREDGITVYDACPDQATFVEFSQGETFAKAVADAGLPTPTITPVGSIHRAVLS